MLQEGKKSYLKQFCILLCFKTGICGEVLKTVEKNDSSEDRRALLHIGTHVRWLQQDNNKMLKLYAHSLEKRGKKKKCYTSMKSVVYPKQLLPLSCISIPYWRTSDTLLTFRSINNYCSLWDAEREFRDFSGKRHNLLVAVKQLQHILSLCSPPLSFGVGFSRDRVWYQPAHCPMTWRTLTVDQQIPLVSFHASVALAGVLNTPYLRLPNSNYLPASSTSNNCSF